MKRAFRPIKTWFAAAFFLGSSSVAWGGDLENVYNLYLQGNYGKAQVELQQILAGNPSGVDLFDMKKRVGVRALLEMSQNEYLRDLMRTFNAATWQHERTQFKAPRRIRFFIDNFMEDDSTRHDSLPNILAAGPYAIPHVLDYLKEENEDLTTRGLAFQIVLNMGSEAVAPLLPATFSNDPVLLVNVVRLLGITKSPRSIPYLLRLRTVPTTDTVKREVEQVIATYRIPEGTTPTRAYIDEANRYLRELGGVYHESVESDGLLWKWDPKQQNVVCANPLGLSFEYQAQYMPAIWPVFRAEVMHEEFSELAGRNELDVEASHAATLCTWVAQEHRVQELLKDSAVANVVDIQPQLEAFLSKRSNRMTMAHWLGQDILLQGVDMAQNLFHARNSSRILRMLAAYQPLGVGTQRINSFTTSMPSKPLLAGLGHREELVRYWSAIAIARSDRHLRSPKADKTIDLLQQAVSEVVTPSALIVSQPTVDAERIEKKLFDLGYLVQRVSDGLDALQSLREFPSKDLMILDPDFEIGYNGLAFVNQLRADQKGKDVPLVILSDEARSGQHFVTFQEQAQELIFGSDSMTTLKEKFEAMDGGERTVSGPDTALEVSFEALNALSFLDEEALRRYPSLAEHLGRLLQSPLQPEPSQILAIRTLRKLGPVASDTANILLDKLDDPAFGVDYKIVVLHALLTVAGPNENVRSRLFEVITSPDSPDSFKQMAASYLSGEYQNLSEEERKRFKDSFSSEALLGDGNDS